MIRHEALIEETGGRRVIYTRYLQSMSEFVREKDSDEGDEN